MNYQAAIKAHLSKLKGQAAWAARHLESGTNVMYNHRRFLAASTIKLPILAVYAEQRTQALFARDYEYDPDDYCEDSPCFDQVQPGSPLNWDQIAEWMMTRSDNTATNLLIDRLGIPVIQAWIQAQGWQEMQLNRRMMDLEARLYGVDNWTTPYDMMQFMERLALGELLPEAQNQWVLDVLYRCEDPEKIPFLFKPPIRVANKPGELPGTRSDVGLVHDEHNHVVMALFVDQLPNPEEEVNADLWLAELAQILWQALTE